MKNIQEDVLEQKEYFEEGDLPPQLLEFSDIFNKEDGEVHINDTEIREYHNWMDSIVKREKAYSKVWKHLDQQNERILTPLQINNHGREHGNRVAGLTGLLYLSIRGPQKLKKLKEEKGEKKKRRAAHHIIRSLITVAEPAGQMHDVGYSMPLEGNSITEMRRVFSSGKQRAELPEHAECGAVLVKHGLEKIYKTSEEYSKFFQKKYAKVLLWPEDRYHDSFNQCVRAIRQHTSQQIRIPITNQQTAAELSLLVFCADKLDFLNRVPGDIDHEKLFEKGPQVHQRLNLAITRQSIQVSKQNRHVTLTLDVDPNIPVDLAKDKGAEVHYGNEDFKKEFFATYGGSFEEIETIFKVLFTKDIVFDEKDLNHSTFSVKLRFPGAKKCHKIFIGRRDEQEREEVARKIASKFLKEIDINT